MLHYVDHPVFTNFCVSPVLSSVNLGPCVIVIQLGYCFKAGDVFHYVEININVPPLPLPPEGFVKTNTSPASNKTIKSIASVVLR